MDRTERSRVSRGAILVHERVLSDQDIVAFGQLTGDLGVHHLADGPEPPIAQGLLVAALPTKLGGPGPARLGRPPDQRSLQPAR